MSQMRTSIHIIIIHWQHNCPCSNFFILFSLNLFGRMERASEKVIERGRDGRGARKCGSECEGERSRERRWARERKRVSGTYMKIWKQKWCAWGLTESADSNEINFRVLQYLQIHFIYAMRAFNSRNYVRTIFFYCWLATFYQIIYWPSSTVCLCVSLFFPFSCWMEINI